MYTLVIYDIKDDLLRTKVAQTCKRYGLARVQKSAFLGIISSLQRKELVSKLETLIRNTEDNIQVYIICRADISMRIELGKPYRYVEESDFLV